MALAATEHIFLFWSRSHCSPSTPARLCTSVLQKSTQVPLLVPADDIVCEPQAALVTAVCKPVRLVAMGLHIHHSCSCHIYHIWLLTRSLLLCVCVCVSVGTASVCTHLGLDRKAHIPHFSPWRGLFLPRPACDIWKQRLKKTRQSYKKCGNRRNTASGTTGSAGTEQRETRVYKPPGSDWEVIVPEKLNDLRVNTDRQAGDMKRCDNKNERSTEKKKIYNQASGNSGTE